MARPSENPDNPLQRIRLAAGKTQQEFADILGISKSEVSKRETGVAGYTSIPASLLRKLAHEFGVVLDPRPGNPPMGVGGETFDRKYVNEYRQDREESRLVKYPPLDLVKAVAIAAQAAKTVRQEENFARTMEQAVQVLCLSPRLAHEISRQLQKAIDEMKPEDVVAVRWLARTIGKKEMVQGLPTLTTIVAHQAKVQAKTPEVKGLTKENLAAHIAELRAKKRGDFEDFDS